MHKTELLDNDLLQQNINTSSLLIKIPKTPGNLYSTHIYKQKLKMFSPHTTEKHAPDI
jgi:hypothetical protein